MLTGDSRLLVLAKAMVKTCMGQEVKQVNALSNNIGLVAYSLIGFQQGKSTISWSVGAAIILSCSFSLYCRHTLLVAFGMYSVLIIYSVHCNGEDKSLRYFKSVACHFRQFQSGSFWQFPVPATSLLL